MTGCPNCEASDAQLIPVWPSRDACLTDDTPTYIACESCRCLMDPMLMPHSDEELPPQQPLTDHEVSRLPIGNQHTDDLSIIEWQCVKGAASYFGVRDWMSIADTQLTAGENVALMEQHGSQNKDTTLRKMRIPDYKHEHETA